MSLASDCIEVHTADRRVPAAPADLTGVLLDPAQRSVAEAFWRLGYAAALDRPRTWRDDIPPGVRVLADPDFHSAKEG